MTFRKAIKHLGDNKTLSARKAVIYGVTTFIEIIKLIMEKLLKNDTNRFEELVNESDYKVKAHHFLRFIDKISSKGIVLATIFRDKTTKSAFIRDCGTMIGLLTKFYDTKYLSVNQWLEIITDINSEYSPSPDNQTFTILMKEYFESLSEQEKTLKRSLKEIVEGGDELRNYFMDTTIPFELNLFTTTEHTLDMQKANKTEKPWNPFDFYDTPLKSIYEENYHRIFLGSQLLADFSDKNSIGTKKFLRGRIASKLASPTQKKRVWCLVPVYQTFMTSRFVDDIQDLDTAAEMIARFSDYKKENIYSYWNSKWEDMIGGGTTYSEMKKFYTDEYLEVFQDDNWEQISKTIKELSKKYNKGKIGTALADCDITHPDTAMYFISLVLWFKQRYPTTAVDKIVKILVEYYCELLRGDTQWYNKETKTYQTIKVIDFFGVNYEIYQSTSIGKRIKHLFTSIPAHIDNMLSKGKTDRSKQQTYKETSVSKHYDSLKNASLPTILYLYPISSTEVKACINFKTMDNLRWIHSNHGKNKAIDGFLGFDEDNKGKYKDFDWVEFGVKSQGDYWKKIIEHNYEISQSTDAIEKIQLGRGIDALSTIIETDLEVK